MKATPLVLLHGYPFDHTMWSKVRDRLTDAPITPDLPGFGQTRLGNDEPSLNVMAEDVLRMLDQKAIQRAVMAGFSMGGYVALAFAERHPERLAGFGLINSQTLSDTDEVRAGRRAMIEKVRREGIKPALDAAIPKLFSSRNPAREELARFPTRGAELAGTAGITWALEAMARRPDRTAALKDLAVPVLLIHSTEDQFIPIERSHALAEQMPDALSLEISGGHCSPLEAPELVAKALGELLGRVESQRSQALKSQSAVKQH